MWRFFSPLRSGSICLYAGKAEKTWAMHLFAERTEEIYVLYAHEAEDERDWGRDYFRANRAPLKPSLSP